MSIFTTIALALLPTRLARLLSPSLRRGLHPSARVGFSLVRAAQLVMGPNARIGHGSVLRCARLDMGPSAEIGHGTRFAGNFDVLLAERAVIGHFNTVTRAAVQPQPSRLALGMLSKVTTRHRLDLTCDIEMGDHSTIAGGGCQLWTHGYVHDESGPGRYRIDGSIRIGHSVYIGTMSFVSAGVRIADGVIVGGGSSIGSDLLEPGLYVSAPIRRLPRPADPATRADLARVEGDITGDIVYRKRET